MTVNHYSNYESIDAALIGFCKLCRQSGIGIGLNHGAEAMQAARLGFISDNDTLYYTLKSLFCTKEEDFDAFKSCFDMFWRNAKHEYAHKIKNQQRSNVVKQTNSSLVMMGFNPNGNDKKREDEEDAKNISGASSIENLKQTDFRHISNIENGILDDLIQRLVMQLNHKLKRKTESTKKGKIDLRKTIRRNISTGSSLMDLSYRDRKEEKYRIVLLLDVSGSMDKYSFFLLKFIWSLKSRVRNIEAFVFSTRLIRVTDHLHENEMEATLREMSDHAHNWSGGTKIGASLQDFNERYSKRILNGKSITIVLSDGLDDGNPEILKEELRKIKMRTSKLVWMNPMKGAAGYEPLAKGMNAALSELDVFSSAHNLESLMELENILADV
ncbi:MAG: VWA domain-containing protein [Cyclobacteriaceae bacterium]